MTPKPQDNKVTWSDLECAEIVLCAKRFDKTTDADHFIDHLDKVVQLAKEKGHASMLQDVLEKIEGLREDTSGAYGGIESCEYGCLDTILNNLKAMLMKGENPFLTPQENHNQLPMSSNKDISEISQVAEECGSLNQGKRCDKSPRIGSSDNKCNSPPLAPDKPAIRKGCGKIMKMKNGCNFCYEDNLCPKCRGEK